VSLPPLLAALDLRSALELEIGQPEATLWWLWRLRGTRIRYTRLVTHLIDGDLAYGIEEGGDPSSRCFPGMVDLVQSKRVIY
jgi:hypothetical protein